MALFEIEANLVPQAVGQSLERLPVIEAWNPERLAFLVEVGPHTLQQNQLLLEPFRDAGLEDLEHALARAGSLEPKRYDDGNAGLRKCRGLEHDAEPIEPPQLARQNPADVL